MYKTIKALEGIAWNNGNTLILPIIIVQGTVLVYTDGLFSLAMFTLYLITFRADTKVWTPVPYVTRHFRVQRGAASLRYRNRAEITVLMCEQRYYLVWFSCRRKSFIVWTYNYEWQGRAIFNWVLKVIQDWIGFALLCCLIGLENSRHPLSESDVN